MVESDLAKVVNFLQEIGLRCEFRRGATGFAAGVAIESGALFFDSVATPSTLLHEAAHVAITPARFRSRLSGDLKAGLTSMLEEVDFSDPDSAEARAAMQCSDPEATAWAWAAGTRLGLAPDVIIMDEEYSNTGASVRLALQLRADPGIHGLAYAGFCVCKNHALAALSGLPVYPELARWLQH